MAHHHQQAYGYVDFSPGGSHGSSSGMQGLEASHGGIFELQAGMEMLGMPSRGFFPRSEGASPGNGGSHPLACPNDNSWQQPSRAFDDDPALDRPNIQGLSLSLPHPDRPSHGQSTGYDHHPHQQPGASMDARFYQTFQLRSSMYLIPAQELLMEFCNLGSGNTPRQQRMKEGESSSSSSPSWTHSALFSMDVLELQRRKARLLSMLEEVDRRYKRYCEQMRAVVASFEAVAGQGSATVYSALASKTISRHFRCVRDGIASQIQATKKAMGEKDPAAAGGTRGETPRLKLLDQRLRQQRVFQQGGALESPPWRPQRGLPERSVSILRAWLFEHFLHPYPSDVDKHILARQTGLSRSQVSNWFINARVRLWKPMVEEMYLEETKEHDIDQSSNGSGCERNDNNSRPDGNPNPSEANSHLQADQKPRVPSAVHVHIESGSLTSIISGGGRRNPNGPRNDNIGVVDLDFAAFSQECSGSQSFRNGVSLTLGLQQHTGGGMGLSFSPTSHQQSVFYSREQMEDCQPAQLSILDGDQGQNLPYMNLMGSQLLHDLAG